ncbi:hypothetical protein MYX82_02780 [Acidobacteria bacterium AH-259-D05]|nr:hypothetical protein [Acidobacteria bacterium AH-259-D05]
MSFWDGDDIHDELFCEEIINRGLKKEIRELEAERAARKRDIDLIITKIKRREENEELRKRLKKLRGW